MIAALDTQLTEPAHMSRRIPMPSPEAVTDLLTLARRLLFPHHHTGASEADLKSSEIRFRVILFEQVAKALKSCASELGNRRALMARAHTISADFVHKLPGLRARLEADVQAAYEGDPSLHNMDEAVLCYPGIGAVICYRLAHELHVSGVPLLPRMMTAHAHSVTGIDIHPAARIGERFFIDHGTGVVIGETAVIGNGVRLYQGVTLGAKKFVRDANGNLLKGVPRHPILEDDVVVYAWASIMGPITIGRGAVIGSNVWVARDVSPGSLVVQAPVRLTRFADGAGI